MALQAEFLSDAPVAEDRDAPRRQLRLAVESVSARGHDSVLIHNLSRTGLLIESEAGLAVGESFEVALPEAGAKGARVVWNSGPYYGCEFNVSIGEGLVSAAELKAPPLRSRDSLSFDADGAVDDDASVDDDWFGDEDALSPRAKVAIILGSSSVLWGIIIGTVALVA